MDPNSKHRRESSADILKPSETGSLGVQLNARSRYVQYEYSVRHQSIVNR